MITIFLLFQSRIPNFLGIVCLSEMGITGEIVRNVFSKSRSVQRHESNGHHQANSNGVEKKRWSSSVRSYLCGDECNTVLAAEDSSSFRCSTVDLASFRSTGATNTSTGRGTDCITSSVYAEEDTASVRSSEATVDQPQPRESKDENSAKENTTFKLFQQEDAALIIQSAFRSFQARRAREGAKTVGDQPAASPSRESIGTSIEVQTGNSSDIFSIKEDSFFEVHHSIRHRTRAQVLKIQEDWDDSTVSSVISKTRMQNRLEAATRRERALAYAFSQQLRLCSKRKQIMGASDETNTGWSWLQRWMAARDPEITLMEADNISGNHKITLVRKRVMDSSIEEKESCGSNEVSSLTGNLSLVPRNVPRPAKARSKATRSFSRQGSKVMINLNMEEKRKRAKQPGNKREIKNATANQESLEHEIEQ